MKKQIKIDCKKTELPITGLKTCDFIGVPKNHKIIESDHGYYKLEKLIFPIRILKFIFSKENILIVGFLFFGFVILRLIFGF